MKTTNKVIIGGVVIAIAYFLWNRNKKGLTSKNVSNLDLPTGMDLPNLTPSTNVPTEKVVKDSLFNPKPKVDNSTEQARLAEEARLALLEKARIAENERQVRIAQEEYAKQVAESQRQAELEKERLAQQDRLAEKIRFAELEQQRLMDERQRIANEEKRFLIEEAIRNAKNNQVKDVSEQYNQRFLDGVVVDRNRYELVAV